MPAETALIEIKQQNNWSVRYRHIEVDRAEAIARDIFHTCAFPTIECIVIRSERTGLTLHELRI